MRIKFSFAIGHNDFIEKLYNILDGALGEYYKAIVAGIIGETKFISHWENEVEDHFLVFSRTLRRHTKTAFNKLEALEAVLDELVREDSSFRKSAILRLKGERYQYSVPKKVGWCS